MNKEKLKLSPKEARMITVGDSSEFKTILNEITGNSRWSIFYRIVVQRESDGLYFADEYSRGATECQGEIPYEYTTPNFTQVFPVEKKVIVYE